MKRNRKGEKTTPCPFKESTWWAYDSANPHPQRNPFVQEGKKDKKGPGWGEMLHRKKRKRPASLQAQNGMTNQNWEPSNWGRRNTTRGQDNPYVVGNSKNPLQQKPPHFQKQNIPQKPKVVTGTQRQKLGGGVEKGKKPGTLFEGILFYWPPVRSCYSSLGGHREKIGLGT